MGGLRNPRFPFLAEERPYGAAVTESVAMAIREGLMRSSEFGTDPVEDLTVSLACLFSKKNPEFSAEGFIRTIAEQFDDRGGFVASTMEMVQEAIADRKE